MTQTPDYFVNLHKSLTVSDSRSKCNEGTRKLVKRLPHEFRGDTNRRPKLPSSRVSITLVHDYATVPGRQSNLPADIATEEKKAGI
jgi:hypothetical protein